MINGTREGLLHNKIEWTLLTKTQGLLRGDNVILGGDLNPTIKRGNMWGGIAKVDPMVGYRFM